MERVGGRSRACFFALRRGKVISGNARTEALWPWAESRPEARGQDGIG